MHFLKKHIKPITIAVLSVGGAISLSGFVTFLVAGTHNVVKLTNTPTEEKLDVVTASNASGWLNYDNVYWTEQFQNPQNKDKFGKLLNFSFDDFIKYTTNPIQTEIWNTKISENRKMLSDLRADNILKKSYEIELNYEISYYESLLNVSSRYNTAIAGCVLLPLGIVLAFICAAVLIMWQKHIPITDLLPITK